MARKSNNVALAWKVQAVRDVYEAPNTTTDLLRFSNCRLAIDGITIANDEYTGSPFRNADALAGKRISLTFNVKMRPPGSVPAANAWVPGRLLQSAKMTELRNTTAIPAAAEALGAVGATTKIANLGASALTTEELYRAYPLLLHTLGATFKSRLTAIRSYAGAGKLATLMEELGGAPSGNYQIPTFLAYHRDVSATDPILLSGKFWLDGHLHEFFNGGVTGMRWIVPTSTTQGAAFPEFEFTVDVTLYANSEEATPAVPAAGAVPLFKDGKMIVDYKEIGTSTFTVDLGLQADYPPNPNQVDGNDAPELAGGTGSVSMTRQKYLPSYFNALDLAEQQLYHPMFAQWGNGTGTMVQILVPDARFNYPAPDLSGGVMMEGGDLFIDVLSRNLAINFPV